MNDFWKSAGMHLVTKDSDGRLIVTDDLLRAYLTRPEIHPIEESCKNEHRLFESLMDAPKRRVPQENLESIADQDTANNYRLILSFRDHLLKHETIEAAYMGFFKAGAIQIPPVFLDQIVHLILRNILQDVSDPMQLRAAELFFREQVVTLSQGTVMMADQEIVEMRSHGEELGGIGQLLIESGTPIKGVDLDVLDDDNKHIYWQRSDRFDTAIDFRFTQPAPDALARVIEKWLLHFLGLQTMVQTRQAIRDERWTWHIGCDASATRILNALYDGEDVPDVDLEQILALYRVEFAEPDDVIDNMRGKPVYLGLAMDKNGRLKMKPQNLLMNIPLKVN